MALNIVVMYGSVRPNRQGIKAAKFVISQLEKRGHNVSFADAKALNIPLLEKVFKDYEKDSVPEGLQRLAKMVETADAYVLIAGEYNHGVQPGLKNMIDYFFKEYFFRPSAIVSYSSGAFAGMRAAMQWRAILAQVGMSPIPTIFSVPKVQDSFDEQGKHLDNSYEEKIQKFLDELEWYANALKEARAKGLPY